MNLREYLNKEHKIYNEIILGREIMLEQKPAFLIAIEETNNPEYEMHADDSPLYDDEDEEIDMTYTQLFVLREDENHEYEDDEEDDYMEEKTNRQQLTEDILTYEKTSFGYVDSFIINGNNCEVYSGDFEFLDCCSHENIEMLKHFVEKNMISETWLEKDISCLTLYQYELDNSIFDILSCSDIVNIEAVMAFPPEDSLIGKTLNLSYGHYDIPKGFYVKDSNEKDIYFKIYGVFALGRSDMENIIREGASEFEDDEDIREYTKETEVELNRIFADNRKLLVIEYSTDDDLQLNFYTKEYLDSKESESNLPGLIMGSFDEDDTAHRQTDLIGITFSDYNDCDNIEVELLSCTRF